MTGLEFRRLFASRTAAVALAVASVAMLTAKPVPAQTAEPSVRELQKELRKRDVLIENLVRRVEKLEHQVKRGAAAESSGPRPSAARAIPVSHPPNPGPAPVRVAVDGEQTGQAPPPAAAPAPPPPPAAATRPSGAKPPAPGQFEVSEEAAERALERTLVATGNLVVPAGFAEFEPLVSYTRRETPTLVLFNLNRNEIAAAADLRVGLPWESQLEMFLPWNFQEQQVTDIAVSPPQLQSNRWGNAVGDLTVGLAKTFFHESGWMPSLLGRATWEIPTGPSHANGVPLTSDQNKLGFSVSALKRQDPLVFVATAGYAKAFETNHVNPGNSINLTTGAFLATSPETTLRGVLSQNFVQDVSINGIAIRGSNTVQPILTFGASSILGRGLLVDLQVGLGLTNTAPKYTVVLSSTYRFGIFDP